MNVNYNVIREEVATLNIMLKVRSKDRIVTVRSANSGTGYVVDLLSKDGVAKETAIGPVGTTTREVYAFLRGMHTALTLGNT